MGHSYTTEAQSHSTCGLYEIQRFIIMSQVTTSYIQSTSSHIASIKSILISFPLLLILVDQELE